MRLADKVKVYVISASVRIGRNQLANNGAAGGREPSVHHKRSSIEDRRKFVDVCHVHNHMGRVSGPPAINSRDHQIVGSTGLKVERRLNGEHPEAFDNAKIAVTIA